MPIAAFCVTALMGCSEPNLGGAPAQAHGAGSLNHVPLDPEFVVWLDDHTLALAVDSRDLGARGVLIMEAPLFEPGAFFRLQAPVQRMIASADRRLAVATGRQIVVIDPFGDDDPVALNVEEFPDLQAFAGENDRHLVYSQRASGRRAVLNVLDWRTATVVRSEGMQSGPITGLTAVSADARWVALTPEQRSVLVWDDREMQLSDVTGALDRQSFVNGMTFAPQSTVLAIGTGTKIQFLDTQTWQQSSDRAEFGREQGGRGGLSPLGYIDDKLILTHDGNHRYIIFNPEVGSIDAQYSHRYAPTRRGRFFRRPDGLNRREVRTFAHALSTSGNALITYPEGDYNLQFFDLADGLRPVALCRPLCYGGSPIVTTLMASRGARWLLVTAYSTDIWNLDSGHVLTGIGADPAHPVFASAREPARARSVKRGSR